MKKLFLSVFVGAVVLTATACGMDKEVALDSPQQVLEAGSVAMKEPAEQDIKINSSNAEKYPKYKSVQELEASSDLIVLASFTGERKVNVYKGAQVETTYTNSISSIEIQKVFKGDIPEKTKVQTYEPGYIEKHTYNNVAGYNLVNNTGKYVLFLRKNDNNIYTIVGMYQGKFDLNAPEQMLNNGVKTMSNSEYLGENVEHFNKLKQEVFAKYAK
jgi:hypothetical protein